MQYTEARHIASDLYTHLFQFCKIINIAGSIRRQKPQVKDIEIVCVPETFFTDMFQTETQRTVGYINAVQAIGKILKGDIHKGRYMQIELPAGIMLDLFTPAEYDYYRIYAIRTGSAEYAHQVIANGWLRKGWCGTDKGLRLQSECTQKEDKSWKCTADKPTLPPVWQSEKQFFEWIAVTYYEPKYREINQLPYNDLAR